MNGVDRLFRLFERHGDTGYAGECVTLRRHLLLSAHQAFKLSIEPLVVGGALAHDIGELLLIDRGYADDIMVHTTERHEAVGAAWAKRYFRSDLAALIGLHIKAKRYLCADSAYARSLSCASKRSLLLQGGAMSANERRIFESHRLFNFALMVRMADDSGKDPDPRITVPDLESYRRLLEGLMIDGQERGAVM